MSTAALFVEAQSRWNRKKLIGKNTCVSQVTPNEKDFFKGCVMTSGDIQNAAFEESKIRNLRYYMIYIERKECTQI